jgi:hypothetical protein
LYTPDAHFSGRDSFTFRVIDGNSTASGPAVVSLTGASQVSSQPQPRSVRRSRPALRADVVDEVFSDSAAGALRLDL